MKPMKLIWLITILVSGMMASASSERSPWEQPAATMAGQIAEILGPGQARLTIRNLSTIPHDEIPVIRRLMEQDLKTHGVLASGSESANEIRMTLSENQRERLWVAEVVEGNETRVAMVGVDNKNDSAKLVNEPVILHKQTILIDSNSPSDPILYAIEKGRLLLLLHPENISVFNHTVEGWHRQSSLFFNTQHALSRDSRGILIQPGSSLFSFAAFLPGLQCTTEFTPADNGGPGRDNSWPLLCHASDDPWPIMHSETADGPNSIKAFYNSARNFFTGVVSPSLGVELPPFYSSALLPRPSAGEALLVGGIDGKVQLLENGGLKQVSGARDWGSDFAVLHSGCGVGAQIIASGSGEAVSDSLRAYELPAKEAVPVSAALAVDGSVTALWAAPDGKSIFAVVRSATNEYEVDRVTATCN